MLAGLMTAAAISGSILFVSTSKNNLAELPNRRAHTHKKFADKIGATLPVAAPVTRQLQ